MANSKEMTRGAVFPLLFSFTMPLLLGNLLQQTYSLIDAAIVGKFLGINSLAAVGASTSVIFLILGFCNGCCAGFGKILTADNVTCSSKVRGEGLCDDAPLRGGGVAIGYGDVRGDRRCLRFLLPGYLAGDADTREYLRWGL